MNVDVNKVNRIYTGSWVNFFWPRGLICPSAVGAMKSQSGNYLSVVLSYGVNITRPAKLEGIVSSEWYPPYNSSCRSFRATEVKSPSKKLHFADATDRNVVRTRSEADKYYFSYGEVLTGSDNSASTAYRHQYGANITMFDGHTEWRRFQEVSKVRELWLIDL